MGSGYSTNSATDATSQSFELVGAPIQVTASSLDGVSAPVDLSQKNHANLFSFNDAIYDISTGQYMSNLDAHTKQLIFPGHKFDIPFCVYPTLSRMEHVHMLPTPLLDQLFLTQGMHKDHLQAIYVTLGRLFFPAHERDNWKRTLVVCGNNAKELVADLLTHALGAHQVQHVSDREPLTESLLYSRLCICDLDSSPKLVPQIVGAATNKLFCVSLTGQLGTEHRRLRMPWLLTCSSAEAVPDALRPHVMVLSFPKPMSAPYLDSMRVRLFAEMAQILPKLTTLYRRQVRYHFNNIAVPSTFLLPPVASLEASSVLGTSATRPGSLALLTFDTVCRPFVVADKSERGPGPLPAATPDIITANIIV
jgi:hypothetical protein